jgi:ribonuclease Z
MDLDVLFLGTSGSMPTAQRAPAATLVRRGGERLLFDCAEGTQRQLLRSGVGLVELREVFLTHYHADHYLGLPGMLKTFALRGREVPLEIYGPPGLKGLFTVLKRIFGNLTYPVNLTELRPGDVLERGDYNLVTFPVSHGVSSVGYGLVEHPRPGRFDVETADALGVPSGPERGTLQRGDSITLPDGRTVTPDAVLGPARSGRKLVLTGDTTPAASVLEIAHAADLLVHEATFSDEEEDRAHQTLHSTAREAAEIARAAEVKMLALTHLSNRYFGPELVREARAVFPETVVPKDFDIIELRFEERGGPLLVKGGALAPQAEAKPSSREPVPTAEGSS